jgi:hypothetical protein
MRDGGSSVVPAVVATCLPLDSVHAFPIIRTITSPAIGIGPPPRTTRIQTRPSFFWRMAVLSSQTFTALAILDFRKGIWSRSSKTLVTCLNGSRCFRRAACAAPLKSGPGPVWPAGPHKAAPAGRGIGESRKTERNRERLNVASRFDRGLDPDVKLKSPKVR